MHHKSNTRMRTTRTTSSTQLSTSIRTRSFPKIWPIRRETRTGGRSTGQENTWICDRRREGGRTRSWGRGKLNVEDKRGVTGTMKGDGKQERAFSWLLQYTRWPRRGRIADVSRKLLFSVPVMDQEIDSLDVAWRKMRYKIEDIPEQEAS